MTPADIAEIQQRVDAATPGPWKALQHTCGCCSFVISGECNPDEPDIVYVANGQPAMHHENADLIANAPSDIRKLLADNKKLRKVVFEATSVHLNVKDASKIPIPLWIALVELAEKAEVALGNRPATPPQQGGNDEC